MLCRLAVVFFFAVFIVGAVAGSETNEPFRVALTGKYPPFSFYDTTGELTGFDVDVSREIAKRLDRPLVIIATEWDGILAGLLADKYDAIIGSMAITPERERQVAFSVPYYRSGAQLFVHRSNPDEAYDIRECAGKRIGVVLGETYQRFLETSHPLINTVTLKSTVEIFELLERHRLTGFVSDRLVGAYQIRSAGRPFVPVGSLLYQESMGIPVSKNNPALLAAINEALDRMHADGTLDRIHDSYFGLTRETTSDATMSSATIARKIFSGFGVTLIVGAASILIGFALSIPCGALLNSRTGVWRVPNAIARTVVDFLRGTPVLVQLLFMWMGLGLSPYVAAIATLGINAMAYMAEVVRSGLMSVDPGQARAARALGMTAWQSFRYVVWPQAFRIAVPPLMNSIVALTKDTALISIISIPELIRETQAVISVTFRPQFYYFIAALLFFFRYVPADEIVGTLREES
ncbi:MAG: ABC transporter substrate-binding protein/permease [Planctomycetota bacterium]